MILRNGTVLFENNLNSKTKTWKGFDRLHNWFGNHLHSSTSTWNGFHRFTKNLFGTILKPLDPFGTEKKS